MTDLIGLLTGVTHPALEGVHDRSRAGGGPRAGGAGDFSMLLAAVVNGGAGRASGADDLEDAVSGAGMEEGEEAEAGAEASAEAAPMADVHRPDRDLDRLDPVFRQRLERVVERMEREYGHSVDIVEAHRSQARQDFLYEQGRSRSGQVVTWTRNSNHSQGSAVDVMIDRSYSNREGYERLARIAAEEGLRTLGPADPGHIELPRGSGGAPRTLPTVTAPPAGSIMAPPVVAAVDSNGMARVAAVARVAQVASIARVADVARVAAVDGAASTGQAAQAAPPAPQTPAPALEIAAAPEMSIAAGAHDHRGGGGSGGDRPSGEEGRSSAEMNQVRADPGAGRTLASSSFAAPPALAAPGGSDAVQRAAQILALKEGVNAPVNHLTLRLDAPGGGEDRIRVDLRGGAISTTLSLESAAAAERLASRTPALRQALERHGLDADAIRVRTTPPVLAERLDPLRTVTLTGDAEGGRQPGQQRAGGEGSPGRDAWKEPTEQQNRERDSRHRSRREQPNRGEA